MSFLRFPPRGRRQGAFPAKSFQPRPQAFRRLRHAENYHVAGHRFQYVNSFDADDAAEEMR